MRSVRNILKAVRNFLFSGLNKEFLIFLFFLALSGAFWLLMTLNETMEREFKIPMRLTGVPRNAVITGELPDTVISVLSYSDSATMLMRMKARERYRWRMCRSRCSRRCMVPVNCCR